MVGVVTSLRKALGRFHYWKWVYYTRYSQKYGDSAMPIYHLYFGVMFTYMVVESHQHKRQQRMHDYLHRKEKIDKAVEEIMQEEYSFNPINIGELEASVYRSRTGEIRRQFPEYYQAPVKRSVTFNEPKTKKQIENADLVWKQFTGEKVQAERL